MKRLLALTFAASMTLSSLAHAHGGAEHIQGTVVSASDTTLVVKTAAGKTETVMLTSDTKVMRGKAKATLQDVKAGERVVVHPMKHGDQLMATEIDLAAAKK